VTCYASAGVFAAGTALLTPAEQDLVARLAPVGQSAGGFALSGFLSGLAATVVSPVIGWADELGWRHQTPGRRGRSSKASERPPRPP